MKGNSVQFKVPHFKRWCNIPFWKIQKKIQVWKTFEQSSKTSQTTDARSQKDYINP